MASVSYTEKPGSVSWMMAEIANANTSQKRTLPGLLLQSRAKRASHVHVDRDKASCKVWLAPVALSSSLGFGARELREIERLVSVNRAILLKAWAEFHG